jgi:hypothetical protein
MAIVLSVILWLTDSDYPLLVSYDHCVVCHSLIDEYWLPLIGILWPLCCLSFFDWRILITPYWYLMAIVLSVILWLTDSNYPLLVSYDHCVVCHSLIYRFYLTLTLIGILWPLCCLSFFDWRILITPYWYLMAIVLSVIFWLTDTDYPLLVSYDHCVVYHSLIDGFWLPLIGILWPLCCLSFFGWRILISPYWYLMAIVLSVILWLTDTDYPLLVSYGHCIVCHSLIDGYWLPLIGILWPLCCLSFFDWRILITPYWYLMAIVLSVILWLTDSDYPY